MNISEIKISTIVSDLYHGNSIEKGGYGLGVISGQWGGNINKMVALLEVTSTRETIYCGNVDTAARKLCEITD